MSIKMCACKACGQEIAKNAKVCPHCGAKNKKSHGIVIGILVVCILIAVIGSAGTNDEPKKVDGTGTAATNSNKETVFLVGETAELKNIRVTLVDVTVSTGSDYNKPEDGNIFVLCEFEIANNSSEEITVSSVMSFEAYCDDYTCSYSLSALLEKGNKNQLDGTVAAGKKFNGVIGYEVPSDWKELEVRFTPDVWSGNDIIFIAKNNNAV